MKSSFFTTIKLAAATLALLAGAAHAQVNDVVTINTNAVTTTGSASMGVHLWSPSGESGMGSISGGANVGFTHTYLFTLSAPADGSASAISLYIPMQSVFGIAKGSVGLYTAAGALQGSIFSFADGSVGSQAYLLDAGSYYYQVAGVTTGTAGGNYLLQSTMTQAKVPVPATLALLGLGMFGIGFSKRRKA